MEIMASNACCESLKRAWRRRKYQRLHKRKLKINRLLGKAAKANRKVWKLKKIPKLISLKTFSPIKLFTKFHDAYVETMTQLVYNMGKANNGLFKGKKIAKERRVVSMVSGDHDEVDSRLVLEIYKRLAASRELS